MKKIDFRSILLTSNRKSPGRPICAVIAAEPTMASGIAFAALGAIGGLLVYGVYDAARKLPQAK